MRASARFRRSFFVFSGGRIAATCLFAALLGGVAWTAEAQQTTGAFPAPTPKPRGGFFLFRAPQRPVAQQVVPLQEGPKINQDLLAQPPAEKARVVVSLSRQRVYLAYGNDVVIDSPISSGKAGHTTPSGSFEILAKEPNHFSNIYGNFVDKDGRVVRSGISAKIDSAPSGTHYEGAPMRWFMRLTNGGVGMHVGILPGYAASHGCVRLPSNIAPLIYERVKVGTTVLVQE